MLLSQTDRSHGQSRKIGAHASALALAFALAAGAAVAEDAPAPAKPLTLTAAYKIDVMGVAKGGAARGTRALGNLNLNADADLEAAFGWKGASLHLNVLANHGGRPNDLAATIQGVDNIEVSDARVKLYEAWYDQQLAGGALDVRVGLYDTNTEFDVTDTAGLFLQPTFGIASEIAATGAAGPSIFPSTALAARVNVQPAKNVYARVAVINALAGTVGDPGGVNLDFSGGALVIGEAGWTGRGKIALGAWTYTQPQPDLVNPTPSRSRGLYVSVDQPLTDKFSAFARAGVSDGDTGPFRGSVAIGAAATGLIPGRPNGVLGLGVNAGWLSAKYRAISSTPLASAETALELTYADKIGQHITVQPDLQLIHNPGGDPTVGDALVLGLRATFTY